MAWRLADSAIMAHITVHGQSGTTPDNIEKTILAVRLQDLPQRLGYAFDLFAGKD